MYFKFIFNSIETQFVEIQFSICLFHQRSEFRPRRVRRRENCEQLERHYNNNNKVSQAVSSKLRKQQEADQLLLDSEWSRRPVQLAIGRQDGSSGGPSHAGRLVALGMLLFPRTGWRGRSGGGGDRLKTKVTWSLSFRGWLGEEEGWEPPVVSPRVCEEATRGAG